MDKRRRNLVVKSNELNYFTFYKSSVQLKVFSKLILEIRNNPKLNTYRVQISDLLKEINYHEKDYNKLKETVRKMGQMLEIPQEKGFCLEALFYRINTKDCTYLDFEVNPHLKPHLIELSNNFTSYYFENISRLKSQYSIRLYELLKQFESGGVWKKTIEEIRNILRIDFKQYKRYNDFKKDIILQAQGELEEKTDIKFTFEEHKIGRKIESITFFITKNMKNINPNIIEIESIEQEKIQTEEEIKLIELKQKEVYEIIINELKITDNTLLEYLKMYEVERIEKNSFYTFEKLKRGEIKKSACGYLYEAIKNDRASKINIDITSNLYKEKEVKKKEEKKEKEIQKRQKIEELEKSYTEAKKNFINDYIYNDSNFKNLEIYIDKLKENNTIMTIAKFTKKDLMNNKNLLEAIKNDPFCLSNFRGMLLASNTIFPNNLQSFANYVNDSEPSKN